MSDTPVVKESLTTQPKLIERLRDHLACYWKEGDVAPQLTSIELMLVEEAANQLAAVENEMQVMSDKLTCALLEAKENAEIANEFKLTMEEYRQREAMAYLALRQAAALLSTTPKFSSETLDDIFEYLLNVAQEKK